MDAMADQMAGLMEDSTPEQQADVAAGKKLFLSAICLNSAM